MTLKRYIYIYMKFVVVEEIVLRLQGYSVFYKYNYNN